MLLPWVCFRGGGFPNPKSVPCSAAAWAGDLLVLGVFESELKVVGEGDDAIITVDGASLKALDAALGGIVTELVAEAEFKGKVS